MAFDNKKAFSDWKKAKPLLLTDTGVSEFLRKLPSDASSKTYLADLAKAKPKLNAFMADAKIKAEKKAVTCLKQIHDNIDAHIADVKANRKHVLGDMQGIRDAAKSYLAEAIKNPTEAGLHGQWLKIMQADRGSRIGARASASHAFDPPVQALVIEWGGAAQVLADANDAIIGLLQFQAAKVKEQKPMPDFPAKLLKSIKRFGDAVADIDKVKQSVNSIQL